jgi:ABC-type bacteriocin/lantibiotic exporter with double-glycine peptidase domain
MNTFYKRIKQYFQAPRIGTPVRAKTGEVRWLINLFLPNWPGHAYSVAFAIAGALLTLTDPLIVRWLIDVVLPRRETSGVLLAMLALFVGYGGRIGCNHLSGLCAFRAAQVSVVRLRARLTKHMTHLSASYHESVAVGETQYSLTQDIDRIGELAADVIPLAIRIVLFTVASVIAMFALDVKLASLTLPLLGIFVILRKRFQTRLRATADSVQHQATGIEVFLFEHLSGILQVHLLSRERHQLRVFAAHLNRYARTLHRRRITELQLHLLAMFLFLSGMTAIVGYGAFRVIAGTLSVGSLIAFYTYFVRMSDPLMGIIDGYNRLQRVLACVRRLQAKEALKADVVESPVTIALPSEFAGQIELKNVAFRYTRGREVLSHLNITLHPGEKIGLVGSSGNGKSTLAKLLVRLYDVEHGQILLDGCDIRALRLKDIRSHVCLLPQDTILFDGTLAENILYGKPNASMQELLLSADLAQLTPVIDKLPRRLNEPLGPWGKKLSGGERQRVALARAFLARPRVLILDEAVSALDNHTAGMVLEAVYREFKNRTVIIISHSMNVLSGVDRLLLLAGGQLIDVTGNDRFYVRAAVDSALCERA